MDPEAVVDRLAALPELAGIPRHELRWLVDHGEMGRYEDGRTLTGVDDLNGLVIVISGRFSVRVAENGMDREVREIMPGRVTGYLPFSKMTRPRGYLAAVGPVEFLAIRTEQFREMVRECYDFTAACVQEMLARARVFKSDDKRQEKMAALGRLSAGLAHELNNPASSVVRSAGALDACQLKVAAAARALGAVALDEGARRALEALETAARRGRPEPLTPLACATREDAMGDWLVEHGADAELADALLETGITVDDLDGAASALDAASLPVLVDYVAAHAAARHLSADLLAASKRIHSLVAAVKTHTNMDRGGAAEAFGLGTHLADATALLHGKAARKHIAVEVSADQDLPPVTGSVADLNQVWVHLIDNALDAAPESGRVTIDARKDQDTVVVTVTDNGAGIPDDLRERVFEPFFTTKDVGEGRGLGLDVVRTVVQAHRGAVDFISRPGRTEFSVTLPASPAPSSDH
jgi:signal transduction histidine kinase